MRQFAIVLARKTLPHFADVVLHDVVIVEQPLPRRSDVAPGSRSVGQAPVRILDDLARCAQALEQPRRTVTARVTFQLLCTRDSSRALGEMIRAKQLAPDRAGIYVFSALRRTPESSKPAGVPGLQRSILSCG